MERTIKCIACGDGIVPGEIMVSMFDGADGRRIRPMSHGLDLLPTRG